MNVDRTMSSPLVQPTVVLWSLRNGRGAELLCEAYKDGLGIRLRCRHDNQTERTSRVLALSDVDACARVYCAFYQTEGWPLHSIAYDTARLDDVGALLSLPEVERARDHVVPNAPVTSATTATAIIRYWTLSSSDHRTAACDLVRSARGLEVRLSPEKRALHVLDMSEARQVATSWRHEYEAVGWTRTTQRVFKPTDGRRLRSENEARPPLPRTDAAARRLR